MNDPSWEVQAYMSAIGAKGGKVVTDKKRKALEKVRAAKAIRRQCAAELESKLANLRNKEPPHGD